MALAPLCSAALPRPPAAVPLGSVARARVPAVAFGFPDSVGVAVAVLVAVAVVAVDGVVLVVHEPHWAGQLSRYDATASSPLPLPLPLM